MSTVLWITGIAASATVTLLVIAVYVVAIVRIESGYTGPPGADDLRDREKRGHGNEEASW